MITDAVNDDAGCVPYLAELIVEAVRSQPVSIKL